MTETITARAITKVTDQEGKVLYKWKDRSKEIWNKRTVAKMRQLLHETTLSGTARKAYFPTDYVGGKTGTTNDVKDMWFVGQTANYTIGVWIGRDKPSNLQSIYSHSPHSIDLERYQPDCRVKKRRCRNGTFFFAIWEDLQ
ncbi:hypothetical protein QNH16_24005 [Peribacillus frigoritolerans]|uniref:hypothetical protein n=1 Tax=Peribacillus frigoritolerans TaxID=450367 RepID=UPI0024BF177A|nr:hypothetical protein [Peribacillus frigoritolerans]WHY13750.1 hypothetical protein QNH16_24005 [Peribacillus frigoritolerans]